MNLAHNPIPQGSHSPMAYRKAVASRSNAADALKMAALLLEAIGVKPDDIIIIRDEFTGVWTVNIYYQTMMPIIASKELIYDLIEEGA